MMKVLVLVLAAMSATSAFAGASLLPSSSPSSSPSIEDTRKALFESIGACDEAIFTNDEYLAVSLHPLVSGVGHVRVYSLNDSSRVVDISTSARVKDIKIEGSIAYVLTGISIEGWDIANEKRLFKFATHPAADPGMSWRKQAQGFVLSGDRAVIAHGTLGVTVIDLTTGNMIQALPMATVSAAQDIALVNADQAVLAIDNDDEGMFRGMYLMDLKALSFTKQIKIDNAFPLSVRVLDNDRLMLIYPNAIWRFGKTQALAANKEPKPSRRAWQFPGLEIADLQGKVAFDHKYVYGCFKVWSSQSNQAPLKPLAFELKTLQLD